MTHPTEMPAYTGQEPCVDSWDIFYGGPDESGHPNLVRYREGIAKGMCARCPLIDECLEWGLYRERYGVWGGTTEDERAALRRRAGIVMVTLEAEWNRDHIIRMARTRALSETGT